MLVATAVILAIAACGFFVRLLRGPTLPDRVIGIEGLVVCGVSGIAVQAMASDRGSFLPVLVVLTLVGFVGTASIARFMVREE